METYFKRYYDQIFSDPQQLLNMTIRVSAILVAAAIAWWIFNAITKKIRNKYHDRPFFKNNDQIFFLIKRAGHYSILCPGRYMVGQPVRGALCQKNLFCLPDYSPDIYCQ